MIRHGLVHRSKSFTEWCEYFSASILVCAIMLPAKVLLPAINVSGYNEPATFSMRPALPSLICWFQGIPLSAVGPGIPSAATPTVVAREGAAAAQTVATGPALHQGMAGVVHEQQVGRHHDSYMELSCLRKLVWLRGALPRMSNFAIYGTTVMGYSIIVLNP